MNMNDLSIMNMLLPLLALLIVSAIVLIHFYLKRRSVAASGGDPFEELYRKIHEDIKFSVSPKFFELSIGVNDLVDLAIEIWRMEQRLGKVSTDLPDNQKKGLDISIQKLKRYVAKYDIETIDYTGQKFNEGLNLDVLSAEQDPAFPPSTIKETVEPTVMCKGQVVRKAKIVVVNK